MDYKDTLKDLYFDGKPSGYREFRRKLILGVASLEDKQQHLAGPRVLGRLSGEAWKATENIPIADLRCEQGWLQIVRTLDQHYRYLPETELHEAIDEFLFGLKRKGHEGATSFTSRFKTSLHRLETLISQERQLSKKQPKSAVEEEKKKEDSSSLEESDEHALPPDDPNEQTDETEQEVEDEVRPEAKARAAPPPGPFDPPLDPHRRTGSTPSVRSAKSSSKASQGKSTGTQKGDQRKDHLRMQRLLGTLEQSHTKPKPIFPQSVLGHLFMRKFGLSREQRSHIIRSTGGSSRFVDIEKILRASDYEERLDDRRPRLDDRRQVRPRREAYAVEQVAEASSTSIDPLSDSGSGEEAYQVEGGETSLGSGSEEELQEIYEIQKKAKKEFKKQFRTYKESKKKVREIKRARQPYMPVVAIPPTEGGQSQAPLGTQAASSKTPRYEKRSFDKKSPQKDPKKKPPRREDANLTEAVEIVDRTLTEFNYALTESTAAELEILLASIPSGFAIIDTGCTTSVVGEETAQRYEQVFRQCNFPPPVRVTMPTVELRGFNGQSETTAVGLKWTVQLGSLKGNITTYVVPGSAPFLLSRRVLEGMQATLDLGRMTITSPKHGMQDVPLKQAANGHLLLSLVPQVAEWETVLNDSNTNEPNPHEAQAMDRQSISVDLEHHQDLRGQDTNKNSVLSAPKMEPTPCDTRRAFQTVCKHTKRGNVDCSVFRAELSQLFSCPEHQVVHAYVAYKPRLERIPAEAERTSLDMNVVSMDKDGNMLMSGWIVRPAGRVRRPVNPMQVAIFAFRSEQAPSEPESAGSESDRVEPAEPTPSAHQCDCCCNDDIEGDWEYTMQSNTLETLYEEVDWVDLDLQDVPKETQTKLKDAITAARRVGVRMALSRLQSNRQEVLSELRHWLGNQASKLDSKVGLIEVFTGTANLSKQFEKRTQKTAIQIGIDYGHDLGRLRDRRNLLYLVALTKPDHIWFAPPCKCWGPWSRFNMAFSESRKQEVLKKRHQARRHLQCVSETWHLQTILGGHVHAENPHSSDMWQELVLGPAWSIRIDQCALGLRSPKSNIPVLKPTRIVSTQESLMQHLVPFRCDHKHGHDHLEGNYKGRNLTSWAETYPNKFARVMADGLAKSLHGHSGPDAVEILAQDEEEDQLEEEIEDRSERLPDHDEPNSNSRSLNPKQLRVSALVRKLHVNTGHASTEQMLRLANRCQASQEIVDCIRNFQCPICNELKPPPSYRKSAIPHAENPNDIVGIDFVQVELKREGRNGKMTEVKFNVLTCVDMATGFAQQIIVERGPNQLSVAFHKVWTRPYGTPKIIFMDPAKTNLSQDFQEYLTHHGIQLLHAAAEAHYQLGQVEIANRILRNMANRCWPGTDRPPEEVIEMCATTRNEQLRKHGFSPAQWFLGRDSRHVGMLADLDEQRNFAAQSQILSDPSFASKIRLREEAAKAFHEEHAKDVWRRAVAYRHRPMRGPYVQGQLVYMFRAAGRGQLSTRHGKWLGPAKVIGVESSSNSPIPRLVWTSYNGYLYRCRPEGLRPMSEDETEFRALARELALGQLAPETEAAGKSLSEGVARFHDLTKDIPGPEDFELKEDVEAEPHPETIDDRPDSEGRPHKIRRRFYRSPEYWQKRSRGEIPPLGSMHEQELNQQPFAAVAPEEIPEDRLEPADKRRRVVEIDSSPSYAPTEPPVPLEEEGSQSGFQMHNELDELMPDPGAVPAHLEPETDTNPPESDRPDNTDEVMPEVDSRSNEIEPSGIDVPVPEAGEDELAVTARLQQAEHVFELSIDVHPEDITENPLCLWNLFEECLQAAPQSKAKQRRVEVQFRKLNPHDKKLFLQAMQKEWQSWIDNKVTSLCKARGIPTERIIRARWVLVWKKSSDPDITSKTPKARLVLVGWQDPDLGKVATDSPTLRKETKHLVLSICSASKWKLWGADIKTAFLSGDESCRNIYFRPPAEIKQWMNLSTDDLFRLEKAAYGLAEAPRAWFSRLTRELKEAGLTQSQLDPCLFMLRSKSDNTLKGICGVHVDDLLGGGCKEMDQALDRLRKKLPFGDYRTFTIRYTGVEIRQNPNTMEIEVGQENYIENLEHVETKTLGNASTSLTDPSILRTCAGQLAWVSNSTRPEQAFLASYLQGVQDKGKVEHVHLYNKAVREMKTRKICLKFPSHVPVKDWHIVCIADAGWCTRANGESQGGYILCLTTKDIMKNKESPVWIVDWSSKKLRRVVRSSVAAETMSGQNGLDAIEWIQSLLAEILEGQSPRTFRERVPEKTACLVVDSKGFFDAVTKSCSSPTISVEKRLQIDYAIAKESMSLQNIMVFWTSNIFMCADVLTKLRADTGPFYKLVDTWKYTIHTGVESGKKEKAKARAAEAEKRQLDEH